MTTPLDAAKFYEAYGRALAKWADFEVCLSHLFAKVTDMHETVAARVFFSTRTSSGRLDMLSEALPAQAAHPDTVEAIKALIKKASQYNETRNRLAHEFTAMRSNVEIKDSEEYVLVKAPRLLDVRTRNDSLSRGISTNHLREITDNFGKLVTFAVLLSASFEQPWQHAKHLGSILAMPNLPYTPDQPKRAEARKRPPRPSRAKPQFRD